MNLYGIPCLQIAHGYVLAICALYTRVLQITPNPPFVGYAYQSPQQKADLAAVCPECGKNIDYVAGWYYCAARYISGTDIRAALVSTNSITQGEQVSSVWKALVEKLLAEYNI